jgi:hypothetical protein
MPGKIFVNYRREDGAASAARLRDRLSSVFGAANVFMDVDNLLAGQRFDKELDKALAETDVFLAVIGARWLEILEQRRAAKSRDYVQEEIAAALAREIIVIPVLVERAILPSGDALPAGIRELVLHQKVELAHERFGRDVEDLIAQIRSCRRMLRAGPDGARRRVRSRALVGAGLALVIGAGAVAAYQIGLSVGVPWPRTPAADPNATAEAERAMPETEQDVRRAGEATRIGAALAQWQRFQQSGSTEVQASNDVLIVRQLIDSCLAQVTSARISDLDVSAAYTKANTVSQGQSWVYIPCRDARSKCVSTDFGSVWLASDCMTTSKIARDRKREFVLSSIPHADASAIVARLKN